MAARVPGGPRPFSCFPLPRLCLLRLHEDKDLHPVSLGEPHCLTPVQQLLASRPERFPRLVLLSGANSLNRACSVSGILDTPAGNIKVGNPTGCVALGLGLLTGPLFAPFLRAMTSVPSTSACPDFFQIQSPAASLARPQGQHVGVHLTPC